jgi:hypothetical protein
LRIRSNLVIPASSPPSYDAKSNALSFSAALKSRGSEFHQALYLLEDITVLEPANYAVKALPGSSAFSPEDDSAQ